MDDLTALRHWITDPIAVTRFAFRSYFAEIGCQFVETIALRAEVKRLEGLRTECYLAMAEGIEKWLAAN